MPIPPVVSLLAIAAVLAVWPASAVAEATTLPGTARLTGDVDRSEAMRAGIERFLDREQQTAASRRTERWRRDPASREAYAASVAENRARFAKIIGAVDARVADPEPQYVGSTRVPAEIGGSELFTAYAVRWPVYAGVYAEGLLLEPKGAAKARIVAVPDADQTPEMIAGLAEGLPPAGQYARRLAENGCQVLVPAILSRADTYSGAPHIDRATNQPHREWIYRQAYTFGRHVIGYEVHKILAAVDWFAKQNEVSPTPVGVAGWGEGGLLALYSAALDPRIEAAAVSGYFAPREALWDEPIYRNVFGLLREFGDAEIATLVAPRALVIEPAAPPAIAGPPPPRPGVRVCAAAGRIVPPALAAVRDELRRAQRLCGPFASAIRFQPEPPAGAPPLGEPALLEFLQALVPSTRALAPSAPLRKRATADIASERQRRQVRELEQHTQRFVGSSRTVREQFFWQPLKLTTPEAWDHAMQPRRESFWTDIMGRLPRSDEPLNPRSRELYWRAESTGYEVVLDVLPDVTLWGYLLLPNDLAPGERRPVVVAQHGLSGLPADLLNEDPAARAHRVYKAFALQLVKRGYIVVVPHFPWRAQQDYKRLQRKANPLGLSVFSFILAHHGKLLDWLTQQPFVDPTRIGLYGLSWGGKVAMRVPALEPRYALSICAGDFNEWIWKNTTTDWPNSYMFAPEPDMFDFGLGLMFGHGEMAAMIAPRAFMVERGHADGVGTDEMVAFEYAKVRRLYNQLRIPRQTGIEFFDGGHEIHGAGTFDFLQRHFNWPAANIPR